jgi:hypothetical protein
VTALLAVRHGPRLRAWQREHGDPIAAQLATSPDRWPAAIRHLVESITAADFVLAPWADGDSVLDLVVLARRAGS